MIMMMEINPPALPYSELESDGAHSLWGASCGHHSLAAAAGIGLDRVREVTNGKAWMSPTNMEEALLRLGLAHRRFKGVGFGRTCPMDRPVIARIQFEGRWLNPGVPARVAYQHTHWIARRAQHWILDTMTHNARWCAWEKWLVYFSEVLLPCDFPEVTGWHFTHYYCLENGCLALPPKGGTTSPDGLALKELTGAKTGLALLNHQSSIFDDK